MGMFHLFCGNDDFAVKEHARSALESLLGKDFASDHGLEIIDCAELKAETAFARFSDAMRTPPFLSPTQTIYVKNFVFWEELAKDSAKEILALLLSPLPDYQTLILAGGALDLRKTLGKKLKAVSLFSQFNTSSPSDKDFVERRKELLRSIAQEYDKSIRSDALQFLSENLGTDSGTLRNELDKILCYVDERPEITLADCRAVASATPEAVSWAFTETLSARNTREALKLLDRLLRNGDAEIRLATSISSEFQRLIQTKGAMLKLGLKGRINPRTFEMIPDVVRAENEGTFLLSLHPYRAYKMCERAQNWTPEALRNALSAATAAFQVLVTGAGEPRLVLEQLILTITGADFSR